MRSRHRLQMGRPDAAVVQHESNGERSALVLVLSSSSIELERAPDRKWPQLRFIGELRPVTIDLNGDLTKEGRSRAMAGDLTRRSRGRAVRWTRRDRFYGTRIVTSPRQGSTRAWRISEAG